MGKEFHLTPGREGHIYRTHEQPWKLSQEQRDLGFFIDKDDIPAAPKLERGQGANLWPKEDVTVAVNGDGKRLCDGSEFEWRVYEREWTIEEKLEDALERIAVLEAHPSNRRTDADG